MDNSTVFAAMHGLDGAIAQSLELTYPPGSFATSVEVPILSTLFYCVVVLRQGRSPHRTPMLYCLCAWVVAMVADTAHSLSQGSKQYVASVWNRLELLTLVHHGCGADAEAAPQAERRQRERPSFAEGRADRCAARRRTRRARPRAAA